MIWDFLTRGIAKVIIAHVHPVCSVRYDSFVSYYLTVSVMLVFGFSWSRDGRKLLSAATDNTVSIWDVVTSDCDKTFRFPSPILKVQFHPRDKYVLYLIFVDLLLLYIVCLRFRKQFLISPMKHAAVLLNTNGELRDVPLDDDVNFSRFSSDVIAIIFCISF